jgi:hypothetical protein
MANIKISGGQGSSERSGQLCTRPLHLDVGRFSKYWNSLQRNRNTEVVETSEKQEPSAQQVTAIMAKVYAYLRGC